MKVRLSLLMALAALVWIVSLNTPAQAAPALQLPWPTGTSHRINGGATYNCPPSHVGGDSYAIDFKFEYRDPVSSVANGTVWEIGNDPAGYGIYVMIDHGGGYTSLYGHLDQVASGVSVGVALSQGQVTGYADATGWVEPPGAHHLHFRMQLNGAAYMPEPMSGVTGFGSYGACTSTPTSPYWTSQPAGYYLSSVDDRMVAGDFDGDGYEDVAAFHDLGAATARLDVWLSSGSDFDYEGYDGWWQSSPGGYALSKVGDRFVAGDFNGDGKDDVAAFYDYGSATAKIHVWLSNGSSFPGWSTWWPSDPGQYALSQVGDRLVVNVEVNRLTIASGGSGGARSP